MTPRYALADTDSESEAKQSDAPPQPSDTDLERALRETVAKIFKTGKTDELTVKRVRLAAEKALQIEDGFFKTNGDWKARSDQIIKDEVEIQDVAQEPKADEKEDESAGTPPADTKMPTKRAKPKVPSTPRKRRKTSTESDVDSGINDDDSKGESTKKSKKPKEAVKSEPDLSNEDFLDDTDGSKEQGAKLPEQKEEEAGDSESEMSVVFDEEPQPKRQRQKTTSGKAPGKAKKAPAKAKDADVDPNQAEIKRLQGWLIKCGIRKMWARELAPYDTPKAKIKHLKDMLKEAGMEGRYSLEKARQIKEERELREDLQMVQEGAKRWGKATEGEDSDGQPRRRLNRGRKALAFLESEGEESD